MVLLQTLLGTLVRQIDVLFLTHISVGAMVAVVCVWVGVRAWGIHPNLVILRRGGIALMLLVLLQINTGIVAVVFRTPPVGKSPTAENVGLFEKQPSGGSSACTNHHHPSEHCGCLAWSCRCAGRLDLAFGRTGLGTPLLKT